MPVRTLPSDSALKTIGKGPSLTLLVVTFIWPVIATSLDTASSNVILIVADLDGLIKSPSLSPETFTSTIFGPVSSDKIVAADGRVPASKPVMNLSLMVNLSFVPPKPVKLSRFAVDFIVTSNANELANVTEVISDAARLLAELPSINQSSFVQSIFSGFIASAPKRSRSCPFSVNTRVVSA